MSETRKKNQVRDGFAHEGFRAIIKNGKLNIYFILCY